MSDAKSPPPTTAAGNDAVAIARGIGGALIGAAAGVVVFMLLGKIGVYAIAAIGALTGLMCSLLSQRKMLLLGVICLGVAAVTTFFNEWINNPFVPDTSLGFFVKHIAEARMFWISLLLGGGLAFWFGQGK